MLKLIRLGCHLLVGLALLLGVPYIAYAQSTATVGGIVQSYASDGNVRWGMIVGLKGNAANTVEPLTSSDSSHMLGIAIPPNDAAVTLSGDTPTGQIYVATQGQYNVLVSSQNGPIAPGDYITISALNGIGMKATSNDPIVLGKAVAAFTGIGNVESTAVLKVGTKTEGVGIGTVPVDVSIGGNPSYGNSVGAIGNFLESASSAVARKPVNAPRVYMSLLVLIIDSFIAGSLIFSGVRNSIISIGRNPLAKRSIFRGLLQVVLTSLIIFFIGLFAVYLLLRL